VKDPPKTKKTVQSGNPVTDKEIRKFRRHTRMSVAERQLKGLFLRSLFYRNILFSFKELESTPSHSLNTWFCLPGYAEFVCSICLNVMEEPLTTPCGHNFCKTCLLGSFEDKASVRERSRNGRTLRAQKIVKECRSCPTDICDFLENPQVQLSTVMLKHDATSKVCYSNAS
jgi:E3 ubiquitin-protein ligase UHRF1